ncbi:hypothetical protein [Burkholderia contaminans]|uniref:hypothetical protein n=1 Tax=Burkholderia contaminans TaxID=488447 RepID=UPI0015889C0D|nr:hypothetical protein [Burkholderia contaminans]
MILAPPLAIRPPGEQGRLRSGNGVTLTAAQAMRCLHDTAADISDRCAIDHGFRLCWYRQFPGERRDAQNSIQGMLHFSTSHQSSVSGIGTIATGAGDGTGSRYRACSRGGLVITFVEP